jgi:hypothetical protein
LTLEPLRAQLRLQQVGGLRSLAVTALSGSGSAQKAQPTLDASGHIEASQKPPVAPRSENLGALDEGAVSSILPDGPDFPTGGGSPVVASKPTRRSAAAGGNVTQLRKGLGRPPRRDKRTAARANSRGGNRGAAEARVRAVLASDPTASFEQVVQQAKVSASSASKWIAVWQAEQAAQRAAAQ